MLVSTTALVWFRRDLRVHDHPALTAAHRECDRVVPVFVLDPRLLARALPVRATARGSCSAACAELREALRERGADLVVREGRPEEELPALARECGAEARLLRRPTSRRSRMARDRRVDGGARRRRGAPPARATSSPTSAVGDQGKPYSVFTPFWRAWQQLPRREVHGAPRALHFPSRLSRRRACPAAPEPEAREPVPARRARRARARARAGSPTASAATTSATTGSRAAPRSSRPTCTSAASRRASSRRARVERRRADAFVRQLAWRDFYAHVLLHQPGQHAPRPQAASTTGSSGTTTRSCSTPGARAAPAIPVVDAGDAPAAPHGLDAQPRRG